VCESCFLPQILARQRRSEFGILFRRKKGQGLLLCHFRHPRHHAPYLPLSHIQMLGSLLLRKQSLFCLAEYFQPIAVPSSSSHALLKRVLLKNIKVSGVDVTGVVVDEFTLEVMSETGAKQVRLVLVR
jgi:hypothetical protein